MTTIEQVILSLLAFALAVFLILSIIIAIQVIRLLKIVSTIADKAGQTVDTVEEMISEIFRNVGGPLALVRVIRNIIRIVNKKRSK